MSGGALDYCYSAVRTAAERIGSTAQTPLMAAFSRHLEDVAQALREVEWEMSGDGGFELEQKVRKCLGADAVMASTIDAAECVLTILRAELARAKKSRTRKT